VFEDILGKRYEHLQTEIWVLGIGDEKHPVKVFNTVRKDDNSLEGYISDSSHVVNIYTNYTLATLKDPLLSFVVVLIRVNGRTIKFYEPEST